MQDPLEIPTRLKMCSVQISRMDGVSRSDLVGLASSPRRKAVRITGGAGGMSIEEGAEVADLLAGALGGTRCDASILAGATTVVDRPNPKRTRCQNCKTARKFCLKHTSKIARHSSVMDVLPRLAELGAPARTFGVAPTISDPVRYGASIIIEDEPSDDYYTIVGHGIPACILVQYSTDRPRLTWDDEWLLCLEYLQLLREEGRHDSLHLVYNGGQFTRNEVLHVAGLQNRQLLLVEDSGRTAGELATAPEWREWRAKNPQVVSCKKTDLNDVVRELGFAPSI